MPSPKHQVGPGVTLHIRWNESKSCVVFRMSIQQERQRKFCILTEVAVNNKTLLQEETDMRFQEGVPDAGTQLCTCCKRNHRVRQRQVKNG